MLIVAQSDSKPTLTVVIIKESLEIMSDELIIETNASGQLLSSYEKRALLGTGGFAQCYQVVDTESREKFALKIVQKKDLQDRKALSKLRLQINIQRYCVVRSRTLRHRNICRFEKEFEDKQNVYMLMELCQNQTLKEFQRRRSRLTEFEVRCYALQLIDGLQYLHGENIIHRDLKLGNVFINHRMELKIGDFGLSTRLKNSRDKRYTTCGTPNYIAPEILAETGHSYQVDIWALGVMIYTLLVGRPTFECESVEDTYSKIKEVDYDFPPAIALSEEVKDLIRNILKKNPAQRLTLEQMKKHPFLSKQLHRVPELLPAYTVSIPPQGSYLRQYGADKIVTVAIMPRKISRLPAEDNKENKLCTSNEKPDRAENKHLFLSSGNIRKQDPDQAKLQLPPMSSRNRILSKLPEKMQVLQSPRFSTNGYETDTTEVLEIDDISGKYGVGYLMANSSEGIIFNDGTSLTKRPGGSLVYYDRKVVEYASDLALPAQLKKKGDILRLVQRNLKKKDAVMSYTSDVIVKKYIKFELSTIVLKLSNGTLQFFWPDGQVSLRGYKWVNYRIGEVNGQGTVLTPYLEPVQSRMKIVKNFLRVFTEKRLQIRQ